MQVYATTFLFAAYAVIIGALFICDYPELFEHPVDLEFMADQKFADALKKKAGVNEMASNQAAGGQTELANQSRQAMVAQDGDKIEEL